MLTVGVGRPFLWAFALTLSLGAGSCSDTQGSADLDRPRPDADADADADADGPQPVADAGAEAFPDLGPPPATCTTLAIDTTKRGFAIPANYVGLAFSRPNISGMSATGPVYRLFDSSSNKFYGHLMNLMRAIGVKHLRLVSGPAAVSAASNAAHPVDPTTEQDNAFFQFAQGVGLGDKSIIYSLHLFNAKNPPSGTSNTDAAAHIWSSPYRSMIESFALDNESDWKYHYRSSYVDPTIQGYFPSSGSLGYRDAWTARYNDVQNAIGKPSPPVPFSGPDTGSNYPVKTDAESDTSINGVPFTLRFAMDQHSRINMATQHYYIGSNTRAPVWAQGSYRLGDVVEDPKHKNFTYWSIKDNPQSNTHPQLATNYWAPYPPFWTPGGSYSVGDEVQDPKDPPNIYRCIKDVSPSNTHPQAATAYWRRDTTFGLLSAHQMAEGMLSAARYADYQKLLDNALANAPGWPSGLRYRMTESNAYSGGRDPASQSFATALWALDYFRWWAARGCAGIDPYTRVVQYNSAIFEDPTSGDYVAQPLAYGMLAFGQGSAGTTINPDGVSFTSKFDWLAAYGVVSSTHLYVTLVNKSFDVVGATDVGVTVKPAGFVAKNARFLVLASGSSKAGDVETTNATLGNAKIPTTGDWHGTWTPIKVNADGSIGPLTVRATSGVVLDITGN